MVARNPHNFFVLPLHTRKQKTKSKMTEFLMHKSKGYSHSNATRSMDVIIMRKKTTKRMLYELLKQRSFFEYSLFTFRTCRSIFINVFTFKVNSFNKRFSFVHRKESIPLFWTLHKDLWMCRSSLLYEQQSQMTLLAHHTFMHTGLRRINGTFTICGQTTFCAQLDE